MTTVAATPWTRADEVNDRLRYYGEDANTHRLLVRTIVRLPEEVAEFALERCRFVSVGGADHGLVLPGRVATDLEDRSTDMWLVVLRDNARADDAESIIAHEIAHAWRRHDRLSLDVYQHSEKVAARLTAEWGFSGLGADIEHATRPYAPAEALATARSEPEANPVSGPGEMSRGVPHADRLYRVDAVAGFLGVSKQTVYSIPARLLPKVRVGPKGGAIRYQGRDVLNYLARVTRAV